MGNASLPAVRWATASLLIAFPVFLLLSRSTYRALRRDPAKRTSKVRKWLSYLTLFVAALVLIGDLVTLVYYLLAGELTLRFILKVLAVGSVAGAVLLYYLWDLRQDDRTPDPTAKRHRGVRTFAAIVTAVVIASVIGGMWLAGSPGRARAERLDEQRVSDLQSIAQGVDIYWERYERLPVGLESLAAEREVYVAAHVDPVTGAPYEYSPTGERSYELCAVFAGAGQPERAARPYGEPERFWRHTAGRSCYSLQVHEQP